MRSSKMENFRSSWSMLILSNQCSKGPGLCKQSESHVIRFLCFYVNFGNGVENIVEGRLYELGAPGRKLHLNRQVWIMAR